MKALNISRMCFIVALLLGLLVAWSAAKPQIISGEQISGAACGCNGAPSTTCPDEEDHTCDKEALRCDKSGNDNCITVSASHCSASFKCLSWWHQSCD